MTFEEALEKIKQRHFFEDKNILKLKGNYLNLTIAHIQANKGWTTNDKEILLLADDNGWTVAHEQAKHGWITNDIEIITLKDKKEGWTVAHLQARYGWRTDDIKILKLKTKYGDSVAHEQAERGWIPTDKKILKMKNKDNWTVAHSLVLNNKIIPCKKEFLELKLFKKDYTLAHLIANHSEYIFKYKKILTLSYKEKTSYDKNTAKEFDVYVGLLKFERLIGQQSDKVTDVKIMNKYLSNEKYLKLIEEFNNNMKIEYDNYALNKNYINMVKFYKKLDLEIKNNILTTKLC
ncbi:hypothetical protein DEFDS_P201 (plasmid) [Deferribacter desulfuricans SSM1]|uniref:Uncharacterized protein n=1 Tax=Deferribacter desulfuricans (strain DSM 14783 / JCM 11476 / NBRC 101012 / SSM1) TaxID=639282 RepID=D3PF29_DEFDS|nr:hypothetical protein [Deferribacter desulfuricans]BAI81821.1 hypothetical protein DEFDS_P201 [Deferribacter desulfuricans SSM1]